MLISVPNWRKNPELTGLMAAWPDLELRTEYQPYVRVIVERSESSVCRMVRILSAFCRGKAECWIEVSRLPSADRRRESDGI